jgi:soluble lytic murein transglycosylase-like protein
MEDVQVNIDPSTIKQLLQLQLLNRMDLIASGPGEGDDSADSLDFAGLLQSLLAEQGASAETAAGSSPSAALPALAALGPNRLADVFGNWAGSPVMADPAAYGYKPAASGLKPAVWRGRGSFAADPAAGRPSSYEPLIEQASAAYGVEPSLVKAVIHQESAYNPYAVSAAGAKGLMQLMDDTGRELGVTDPFDPQQNVHAGTQFLASLLRKYKGNEGVALAAYNAGPGLVDKLGIRTDADLAAKLGLLPQETQHYVQRVLALKDQYGAANKG